MAYYWVNSSTSAPNVPPNAVLGGKDSDGSDIYVGLAHLNGDELPCKVVPRRKEAFVPWNGKEHKVHSYQVLCQRVLQWIRNNGGNVPVGAIPAGRTRQGEQLYIGRARHRNATIVGKVHPSHGVCYIPYGHEEIAYKDYEILVSR